MALLERLKQKQGSLTDAEMAALLNCSRQLWQGTRIGKTPLGATVLKGAARAFPDLQPEIASLLLDVPLQNRPDGLLPRLREGLVEFAKNWWFFVIGGERK